MDIGPCNRTHGLVCSCSYSHPLASPSGLFAIFHRDLCIHPRALVIDSLPTASRQIWLRTCHHRCTLSYRLRPPWDAFYAHSSCTMSTSHLAPGASSSSAAFSSSAGAAAPNTSASSNQLYALASRVPLIKSPSVSLPNPVKLPPDLHPLPADISAYFVYPFSLESYVLDPNTPSSATIDQLLEKHQQYLANRQRQKEERQKALLRKVAPGWQGAVLQPTTSSVSSRPAAGEANSEQAAAQQMAQQAERPNQERTPLDDLADHLAQLDALHAAAPPSRPA